ncbi:MAG: ROK family protein [Myxococcota bacterium]
MGSGEGRRIGVDLGGTKIEAVVLHPNGDIERRKRVPTPAAQGYDAIVDTIGGLVEEVEDGWGPLPVGIGTPGAVSRRTGTIKNSNTVALNGRTLREDLSRRLTRPIRMANDANCLALSEASDGAGSGHSVVFAAILGTGVGGGWCVNGQILNGLQGIAGEWGHTPLEPETGPACYCGRRGCVETLLSGPGLLRDYRSSGGQVVATAEVVERAAAGESLARAVLDRYIARLGRALATVINIVDPDIVVLGGGVSKVEAIYSQIGAALAPHVFNDEVLTPVVAAKHGDSSGVRGAAWLWPVDEPGV